MKRKNKDIREMTPKEYYNYYCDCFGSCLRRAFDIDEILVHISYQPDVLTLDYNQVKADTKLLFDKYTYVEAIERNFVRRRRYNDADYADGFHSHLVMRESDFIKIKGELMGVVDIKDTLVYDLEGLTQGYLAKQTIDLYPRLLPTLYKQPIIVAIQETIEEKVIIPLKKKIILFKNTITQVYSNIKRVIKAPVLGVLNIINKAIQVDNTT